MARKSYSGRSLIWKWRYEIKMNTMLRDISESDILRIDEMARASHMSRNEFIKRLIHSVARTSEMRDMDNKYEQLVEILIAQIKDGRQLIEQNTKVLEEALKRL